MSSNYNKLKTRKDAIKLLKKSYKAFTKLIRKRVIELKASEEDLTRFRALVGKVPLGGPLRGSDLIAGLEFAKYVVDEVQHLSQVNQELDFYHLTLLADEGVMSDREPMFCLRLLKRKADKAMRKAGLEGIFIVETQPLMNWPQEGEGRTILAHVHVLGWMKRGSPGSSAAEIRRALGYDKRRSNLAWSCQFGAAPIVVRSLTEDKGCPSFWAAYLFKAPHDAKSRIPRANHDGSFQEPSFKLRKTTGGYRPEFALRLFELAAHLPIFATIGGVGTGAAILGRCKNRLKLWDAQRRAEWRQAGEEQVPAFDESEFWKRTHKRRRARYLAFFIDGPTIPPPPPKGRK